MPEKIYRKITPKIFLLIGSFVLLILINISFTFYILKSHINDSLIINIAGRQRMLSQRIFKEWLLGLELGSTRSLKHSINLFQESIKALIDGGKVNQSLVGEKPAMLPPAKDKHIRASLEVVQELFNKFLRDLESLSYLNEKEKKQQLRELTSLNEMILMAMDESLWALQKAADERVNSLKYIHYVVLMVTLLLIVNTYLFVHYKIVKPMQQRVNEYNELNQLYHALQVERKKNEDQLILGRKVQERIFPGKVFAKEGLTAYVFYQPLQIVGGDYYDFFELDDNRIGILIADAMGKGVSAALMTAMAKVIFASQTPESHSPARTLEKASQMLYQLTGGESYLTACYIVINKKDNELIYAGAGHPPCLIYDYDKENLQELVSQEVLIGISNESEFSEKKISIGGKTRIILYTDGITEQLNKDGEPLGKEYIKLLFLEHLDLERSGGLNQIMEKFQQNAAEEKKDDITMIIVDILIV